MGTTLPFLLASGIIVVQIKAPEKYIHRAVEVIDRNIISYSSCIDREMVALGGDRMCERVEALATYLVCFGNLRQRFLSVGGELPPYDSRCRDPFPSTD